MNEPTTMAKEWRVCGCYVRAFAWDVVASLTGSKAAAGRVEYWCLMADIEKGSGHE